MQRRGRPASVTQVPPTCPAIKALIDAAYARYLTADGQAARAPMLRDYGPSVEAGTTWVTGSPITAVLTLYPREDHLLIENIAVHPGAQGHGLGRDLLSFRRARKPPAAGSAEWPWSPTKS